ncbi:MAG: YceI family protein [Solirubrobacteraceae bacterium]
MGIQEGTHKIGPDNGTLTIKTGREGAAAKAGHDLTLEATSWDGTVDVGDSPSVQLNVDPSGIEVREGKGGAKALDDGDKQDIKKSMSDKILGSSKISFESSEADLDSGNVKGDLSVAGQSKPISIPLNVGDDGTVSGSVTLSQSDYGIKQFKALMGALKVADTVEVQIEAKLPTG